MNFGLKSIKIANSWTLLSRKEEMTLVQTLIQLIAAVYCLNLGADFIFDFFMFCVVYLELLHCIEHATNIVKRFQVNFLAVSERNSYWAEQQFISELTTWKAARLNGFLTVFFREVCLGRKTISGAQISSYFSIDAVLSTREALMRIQP